MPSYSPLDQPLRRPCATGQHWLPKKGGLAGGTETTMAAVTFWPSTTSMAVPHACCLEQSNLWESRLLSSTLNKRGKKGSARRSGQTPRYAARVDRTWHSLTDLQIVWLECPTNPLLLVPPIPLIVKILDSLPERPLLLVDTTFLSSFYFNPLVPLTPAAEPLADVVLSSLTKYSGGHTDIIMGALIASERGIKKYPNIIKGLRFLQNSLGGTASPRDCHLMIRSIKTLSVRMIRHGLNALRLSAWLSAHDAVEEVRYPGLKTDPAFHMVEQLISENAKRELRFLGWSFPFRSSQTVFDPNSLEAVRTLGIPFGGVINFKLKGATAGQTAKFVGALRLNVLAVSLGGVESLLEVPDSMTHAVSALSAACMMLLTSLQELPPQIKTQLGITPNLVRVSVGLEDVEDLMNDLDGALHAMRE